MPSSSPAQGPFRSIFFASNAFATLSHRAAIGLELGDADGFGLVDAAAPTAPGDEPAVDRLGPDAGVVAAGVDGLQAARASTAALSKVATSTGIRRVGRMRVSSAPRVLKVKVVKELVVADTVYSIHVCAASRRRSRSAPAQSRLRASPISNRCPSGSRKNARISHGYSTGGARNSAPRAMSSP